MKSYHKNSREQSHSVEQEVIIDSEVIYDDLGIRFIPPVYVQRYMAVCKILEDDRWGGEIRKVIDFGCAELGFFQYLRNVPGVLEILEVDIDRELLKYYKCRAAPLTSDYLKKRDEPLAVHILAGSIAEQDSRLRGTDAVVCIELIEHLYPDILDALPYTVFEYIQPKVAIFTTPNCEFNVLLPNLSGFRHDDHKFEWTRIEFMRWARNLTKRYPLYSVSFVGVAPGPKGSSQYGCCSQMAVFAKDNCDCRRSVHNVDYYLKHENVYELMSTYEYPFEVDVRTVEEKIRDEATYHISSFGSSHIYDTDDGDAHVPLELLMPAVKKWCDSVNKLREVLEDSCWRVVESRGQPCVVYSHKRWSEWLTSDDEYGGGDECRDVEKEAAALTACKQETVEPSSSCEREEEDWGSSELREVDQWCLNKASDGEREDEQSVPNSSVGRPESCNNVMPVNSVPGEIYLGESACGRSKCGTADCGMLDSGRYIFVRQADGCSELPQASNSVAGESCENGGDMCVQSDLSCSVKNKGQPSGTTCDQGKIDFVVRNCDSCAKSCDARVVMPENVSVDKCGRIEENVKPVVNLSNHYTSDESCVERDERVDQKCESSVIVNGHAYIFSGELLEQKIIVDSDVICDDLGIRFIPPVYVQRYMAVCKILEDDRWNGAIHKVIDFGCAELGFFQYLRNVPGVLEILEVDIDRELLKYYKCRAAPLTSDYLKKRDEPLAVHILAGSIAEQDSRLRGTDAVVCIELIEHLYPDTLDALPYTVFEYIEPKLAIFTTPNSEFNVLLPNFSGLRHDDHKFEWTREEFMCWAHNLIRRYPQYSVSFVGIASGPDGTSEYGCCSQMAVFVKDGPDTLEDVLNVDPDTKHKDVFELMGTFEYPFEEDTRTVEEKICDEVSYQISLYGSSHIYDTESGDAHVPLELLMPAVKKWCNSINKLREVLEDSCWRVVESLDELCVVYSPKQWCEWLASDDQDDDDCSNIEEEVATAAAYNQESVEPSLPAKQEQVWGSAVPYANVDEWCVEEAPADESEEGSIVKNSVVGGTESTIPVVNSVQEEISQDKNVHATSVLSRTDCKEEECHDDKTDVVCRGLPADSYSVTAEIRESEGDCSFQCDLSSDKNNTGLPHITSYQDQSDFVIKDYDVCGKSCDSGVLVLSDNQEVTEIASVNDDQLITENVEQAVNCAPVAQVCDVMQTVVNLSNNFASSKNYSVKKSEHLDRECGSPALVDGCVQNKRLSRNLEAMLEEGSMVDSYSLEEQNDKAVDSGYPNSTDMDLDLTPEQVDEISMENDVLLTGNSSLGEDSEYEASLSDSEGDPVPPMLHLPGEILRDEGGEGMENGDVANNNQDEEGNNAAAPRPQVGDVAVIDFAVMLDVENENDMANVNPFPDWLLHLRGVANLGNGREAVKPWSDDEDDSSSMSLHGPEQLCSAVLQQGAAGDADVL